MTPGGGQPDNSASTLHAPGPRSSRPAHGARRAATVSSEGDKSTASTRAISDITGWLGSFPAILVAAVLVLAWAVGGVAAGWLGNNTYQLIIDTGIISITILMVFVIQNTQNRDGRALQAKIDAQSTALYVIARRLGVDDDEGRLVQLGGVEDAPESDIKQEQDQVRLAAEQHGT